jgi:YaiO family outer membrane protein
VKRLARFAVFALALALRPCAGQAGELDLTGDLSGFTSPGTVYGPWDTLTGTYRWVAGVDTPSVTVLTRVDHDQLAPTHSFGTVVDDYHTWSPRFFTYAALGLAAGTVLPNRSLYLEGDQKLGRNLATVFGAGVGVVVNPNGLVQRYVNVGPTWYWNNFNVTLRYLQTFTTGRVGSGTVLATIQAGQTGKTISTLTLLAGNQPPNGVAAVTVQPVAFGQRTVLAGFEVKHWIGANGGILAGVQVERLNDRLTGNMLYARRGITLGVFRNIGPALP